MWILGAKRSHQMDSLGRLKGVRILMKSEREMVASDSTISMVARIIDPEVLRKYLIWGYKKVKQEGHMKVMLPERGSVRVADIDTSILIGRLFSCPMMVGDIDILVDAEPIEKMGKELPSSKRLLARAIKELGFWFCRPCGCRCTICG
jgi:hypothetical protein